MNQFVYPKSENPDAKLKSGETFVTVRTDSVGNWVPHTAFTHGLIKYSRMKTVGDGNCFFQALASAAVIRSVKGTTVIDNTREVLVATLKNVRSSWTQKEHKDFDNVIRGEYYPYRQQGVKRTLWRVYAAAEIKELKKTRKLRGSVVSSLDEDNARMLIAGKPVNCGAHYVEYLSATGRQKSHWVVMAFHYDAEGALTSADHKIWRHLRISLS